MTSLFTVVGTPWSKTIINFTHKPQKSELICPNCKYVSVLHLFSNKLVFVCCLVFCVVFFVLCVVNFILYIKKVFYSNL